jgi:hypothetical protein
MIIMAPLAATASVATAADTSADLYFTTCQLLLASTGEGETERGLGMPG